MALRLDPPKVDAGVKDVSNEQCVREREWFGSGSAHIATLCCLCMPLHCFAGLLSISKRTTPTPLGYYLCSRLAVLSTKQFPGNACKTCFTARLSDLHENVLRLELHTNGPSVLSDLNMEQRITLAIHV